MIDIVTASGITIARDDLAADGTGAMVRYHGHVYALDQAAMAGANTGRPHRRKDRIPPGSDALAATDRLRNTSGATPFTIWTADDNDSDTKESAVAGAILYDLSIYEHADRGSNTLR